jgi:hypothetical protein
MSRHDMSGADGADKLKLVVQIVIYHLQRNG